MMVCTAVILTAAEAVSLGDFMLQQRDLQRALAVSAGVSSRDLDQWAHGGSQRLSDCAGPKLLLAILESLDVLMNIECMYYKFLCPVCSSIHKNLIPQVGFSNVDTFNTLRQTQCQGGSRVQDSVPGSDRQAAFQQHWKHGQLTYSFQTMVCSSAKWE